MDPSGNCQYCKIPSSDGYCEVCGRVQTSRHGVPASSPAEVITSIASAGGPAALTAALVAWLKYRTSDLRVKITRKDGTTIDIDGKRITDSDTVIDKVIAALNDAATVEIVSDTPDRQASDNRPSGTPTGPAPGAGTLHAG